MDSNDDLNPSYSGSEVETNPFSEEPSFQAPSEVDSLNQSGLDSEIASSSSQAIPEDKAAKAYIFKYGLFKKVLLPFKEGHEQKMQMSCTT